MAKFLLLSSFEDEVSVSEYNSREQAKEAMLRMVCSISEIHSDDIVDGAWSKGDAYIDISDEKAKYYDGYDFVYTWRIYEVGVEPTGCCYAEVRCDNFDETTRLWSVDAWFTADDDEPGRVVAYVDELTLRVIYVDPLARVDELAQKVIKEKISEIEKNAKLLVKIENNQVNAYMKTSAGTFTTDFEVSEETGTGYDGIFVGLHPKCDPDGSYIDLVSARAYPQPDYRWWYGSKDEIMPGDVRLNIWVEPGMEDPTDDIIVKQNDIKEVLCDDGQ